MSALQILNVVQMVVLLVALGFGWRARRLYKETIDDLREEVRFWKKDHTSLSEEARVLKANSKALKTLALSMVTSHRQMHEAIYNCASLLPMTARKHTVELADRANEVLDRAKASLEKFN